MHILYISRAFPYPLWSGYQRDYYLIRELAKRHKVSLVALVDEPPEETSRRALGAFVEKIVEIQYPKSRFTRNLTTTLGRKIQRGFGFDPRINHLRMKIKTLLQKDPTDAILVSGQDTVPLVLEMKDVPVLVDLCDAFSYQMRTSLNYSSIFKLPGRLIMYLVARRGERRMINAADRVYFENRRDAQAILGENSNYEIIPTGIDLDYWQPQQNTPREKETILFTGNMDYPLNIVAVEYILKDIFPRVLKNCPNAKLILAGRNPTRKLMREASKYSGVSVTGHVDDMRTQYERATVFLAPMRYTSGVHIKLLEAMAMGLPLVTSPQAAEGLRTPDGKSVPIQVESTANGISNAVVTSLHQAPMKQIQASRLFVEQHHSWDQSARKLENLIEKSIKKG